MVDFEEIDDLDIPKDLKRYRTCYFGKPPNDFRLNKNVAFYSGRIKSVPNGDFIDNIHQNWATDYKRLELHHGYIQWLFPIHEEGMNDSAQVLQLHEAEAIRKSDEMMERVFASYKLILGFFGVILENTETGQLRRAPNYKERYTNLNLRSHNYLRITRILKFLGEVGLEKLKLAFLTFFIREVFLNDELKNCKKSLITYWIYTLRRDEDLRACLRYLQQPSGSMPCSILSNKKVATDKHAVPQLSVDRAQRTNAASINATEAGRHEPAAADSKKRKDRESSSPSDEAERTTPTAKLDTDKRANAEKKSHDEVAAAQSTLAATTPLPLPSHPHHPTTPPLRRQASKEQPPHLVQAGLDEEGTAASHNSSPDAGSHAENAAVEAAALSPTADRVGACGKGGGGGVAARGAKRQEEEGERLTTGHGQAAACAPLHHTATEEHAEGETPGQKVDKGSGQMEVKGSVVKGSGQKEVKERSEQKVTALGEAEMESSPNAMRQSGAGGRALRGKGPPVPQEENRVVSPPRRGAYTQATLQTFGWSPKTSPGAKQHTASPDGTARTVSPPSPSAPAAAATAAEESSPAKPGDGKGKTAPSSSLSTAAAAAAAGGARESRSLKAGRGGGASNAGGGSGGSGGAGAVARPYRKGRGGRCFGLS